MGSGSRHNWRKRLGLAALAILACGLAFAGWYWLSPHRALSALVDRDQTACLTAELYDRDRVRTAFARQMVPQAASYPPPFTRDVLLDILSDPSTVRALLIEPYGEWQFAAAEGLPPDLVTDDEAAGPMPRLLETTEEWAITREGLHAFTARGADRPDQDGHTNRFERHGLGWKLVAIDLRTPIG